MNKSRLPNPFKPSALNLNATPANQASQSKKNNEAMLSAIKRRISKPSVPKGDNNG